MLEHRVVAKLKENFYRRIDKNNELQFLDVRMITLNVFKKSHIFKFDKKTSYLSLDDNLKI